MPWTPGHLKFEHMYLKKITVITLAISALISAEEKCEFFIEITVSNFHHKAQMF